MQLQSAFAERASTLANLHGMPSQHGFEESAPVLSVARFEPVTAPVPGGLAPWQIKRVRAHIDANIVDKLNLDVLAMLVKLSTSYFSAAFKRSFGIAPHAYVISRRVERAKQLMIEGMPLCEVALECGLADQAHLSRVFRRVTGTTPRAWRQRQKRQILVPSAA